MLPFLPYHKKGKKGRGKPMVKGEWGVESHWLLPAVLGRRKGVQLAFTIGIHLANVHIRLLYGQWLVIL